MSRYTQADMKADAYALSQIYPKLNVTPYNTFQRLAQNYTDAQNDPASLAPHLSHTPLINSFSVFVRKSIIVLSRGTWTNASRYCLICALASLLCDSTNRNISNMDTSRGGSRDVLNNWGSVDGGILSYRTYHCQRRQVFGKRKNIPKGASICQTQSTMNASPSKNRRATWLVWGHHQQTGRRV